MQSKPERLFYYAKLGLSFLCAISVPAPAEFSSEFFLVYTVINDQRKREMRGKRGYSDDPKTNSTDQEKQQTAKQITYTYNFQSNQATIVVDDMIFLSSFVIPFHLSYSPLCNSEACQIQQPPPINDLSTTTANSLG
ncbi:unnamed protein product [Didymodactylos carnosus]|uniref:Uncharacterized protein n=1 Tax=Didymodactylos carnosus TaxID=1234261 RepID=A0A8S2UC64_9BILA|nr:unnamed protein product [Didymodactylos carnosus]